MIPPLFQIDFLHDTMQFRLFQRCEKMKKQLEPLISLKIMTENGMMFFCKYQRNI